MVSFHVCGVLSKVTLSHDDGVSAAGLPPCETARATTATIIMRITIPAWRDVTALLFVQVTPKGVIRTFWEISTSYSTRLLLSSTYEHVFILLFDLILFSTALIYFLRRNTKDP